jgi:hypothetical protein
MKWWMSKLIFAAHDGKSVYCAYPIHQIISASPKPLLPLPFCNKFLTHSLANPARQNLYRIYTCFKLKRLFVSCDSSAITPLKTTYGGEISMMINPHQALRAASYLLRVNHDAMQEDYRSDIPDMMRALKNIFDAYEKHLQKHYRVLFTRGTIEMATEQKLQLLTAVVNSIASLLLPEAETDMKNFITNLKLPEPIPPYPMLNEAGCVH